MEPTCEVRRAESDRWARPRRNATTRPVSGRATPCACSTFRRQTLTRTTLMDHSHIHACSHVCARTSTPRDAGRQLPTGGRTGCLTNSHAPLNLEMCYTIGVVTRSALA